MHRGATSAHLRVIASRFGISAAFIMLFLALLVWNQATGVFGNLSSTWMAVFGVTCVALGGMLAVDLRRWKRRDDALDESVGATEIGWVLSRKGLVAYGPKPTAVSAMIRSGSADPRPTNGAHSAPDRIEALTLQCVAPATFRAPPSDVAVVSVFRRRMRMAGWVGPASLPNDSAVVRLAGEHPEAVADRLAQALEPLAPRGARELADGPTARRGEDSTERPRECDEPNEPSCEFASVAAACPRCAAPAHLPIKDAHEHPAWCALASAWTCEQCRSALPAGAVVARGQSDGDVRGPGAINVLLLCLYVIVQAATAAMLFAIIIMSVKLWHEFEWGECIMTAILALVLIGLIRWLVCRGPSWRAPILRIRPCRAHRLYDLVVCVTPGEVEIRCAPGYRNARWERHGWRRPAGLHVAHHPEGPLLISPFENSFRLWAFLPSDPRGYRSAELAEALRRAYGEGREGRA